MTRPLISVVIPAHNSLDLLCACLRCLTAQTCPAGDFEVIVADDCSTDGTAEGVERLAPGFAFQVSVVRRSSNGGPGAARNSGIQAARGQIIALLDADTEPEPDWLRAGMAALEGHDIAEGYTAIGSPELITPFTHQTQNTGPGGFPTCNMFFRRKVFDDIGLFDTRFYDIRARIHFREDSELMLRAIERGLSIAWAPEARVIHRPLAPSWRRPLQLARRYRHDRLLRQLHPATFDEWIDRRRVGAFRVPRLRQKLYWSYLAGIAASSAAALRGWPVWPFAAWTVLGLAGIWWLHVRMLGRRAFTSPASLVAVPVCAAVPFVYLFSVISGVRLHPARDARPQSARAKETP